MNINVSFLYETESAIQKACDSIITRNNAELLLELWKRRLISDEVFVKKLRCETNLPINLYTKEP